MSHASSHFGKLHPPLDLPLYDKRLIEWETLKTHIPETRLFRTSTGPEQAAMMEIIQHRFAGKPALVFIEAVNAVGDAIGYKDRYKHTPDALENIDMQRLGEHLLQAETLSIAYTTVSMVYEKTPYQPGFSRPQP